MPIYTPPYTTLTLDANNQRASAALLATTTWTGTWTLWGQWNKLDLVGSIDQAGTLYIDQSRDGGATTAFTEQWAGAIGEAFAFPTARGVGCNAYRLRFLAGGVNLAALVLTPYLTVGEVDHETPILSVAPLPVLANVLTPFVIPVGARSMVLAGRRTASTVLGLIATATWDDGAAGQYGPASLTTNPWGVVFENPKWIPVPAFLDDGATRPRRLLIQEGPGGGDSTLYVYWNP